VPSNVVTALPTVPTVSTWTTTDWT